MATLTMTINTPAEFHPRSATLPTELELRHEALRNRFRNMDIIVPNFYELMPGWIPMVNEVYTKELREKTNNWLFEYDCELNPRL